MATFEPLVRNGLEIWKRPQFVRYWKTGAILIRAIEHEHGLLLAKIAAVTRLEATEDVPAHPRLTSAAILRRSEEREHREGWLLRGMRALFTIG